MSLQVRDLVLGYDGKVIVDGVNLTIPKGKVTVLIGANGCGKSTLLNGMSRITTPLSGEVLLEDKQVHAYPPKKLAQKLALLPQSPITPEGVTVKQLCHYGRQPYRNLFGHKLKEDDEIVDWAIQATGLKEFEERYLDALSGGQRQRAWIAMALAQQTEVLLLDEPTTYLDLSYQLDILKLLQQLNRQTNKTIVMVLHELNQAARFADHLICMKQGLIYDEGSVEKVFTPHMLKEVFGLNCIMIEDPISKKPMCVAD